MGKLERITLDLPEDVAEKLRDLVAKGEYATESEVVQDAMRDWSAERDRKQAALTELRAMIARGDEGPFLDGPAALAELRTKYRIDRH